MKARSAARTHVGKRREINEDAYLATDEWGFYVVADGVGGQNKGEIASEETVNQLHGWIEQSHTQIEALTQSLLGGDAEARWDIRRMLESAVKSACYMVYAMAQQDPDKKGMATTCSALLISGGVAYAAHVGDSRVYRVRGGAALQLTEDHTLINHKVRTGQLTLAQAATATGKNVITRAVGSRDYVQVDTADVDVRPGDRFLICSDGLHGELRTDAEVVELLEDQDVAACADTAIAVANERGGRDNITVIVVEAV